MLRAAARALGAFCDPQLPLWGRADLVRSRLVDQLSRRWQRHMSRIVGVLRGGGCGVVGLWGWGVMGLWGCCYGAGRGGVGVGGCGVGLGRLLGSHGCPRER